MPEVDLFFFSTPERIATYNKLLITCVATTSSTFNVIFRVPTEQKIGHLNPKK